MKQSELKVGDVFRIKEKRSDYDIKNENVRYRVDEVYSYHVVCTKLPFDYKVSFNFPTLRAHGIIDAMPPVEMSYPRNNVDAGMHYKKHR